MSRKPSISSTCVSLQAQALRIIRRARQLTARQVAAALGIGLRSYEYLEAGDASLPFDRIKAFSEITASDPYAILLAPAISPAFALRAADNKLVTAFLIALREFDQTLGDEIAQLDASSCIAAFNLAFEQLTTEARRRATAREALSIDRLLGPGYPSQKGQD